MNVLIPGQAGANKGDRAVLYFMLRELHRNGVREIVASTSYPTEFRGYDVLHEVNVRFVPNGWAYGGRTLDPKKLLGRVAGRLRNEWYSRKYPRVREMFTNGRAPSSTKWLCNGDFRRAMEKSDLVLSPGGHRVTTLLWPDVVMPATYDMALALMAGKPLVLWSQSIGPLEFKLDSNRRMVKRLLDEARLIYVRDRQSLGELAAMEVDPAKVFEVPESVFGLDDLVTDMQPPSRREKLLGISVYTGQKLTPEQYGQYIGTLARVVDHAAGQGWRVKFFPMMREGRDADCIRDTIAACRHSGACSVLEGFPNTPIHMREVSQCRTFIGHKTHSVIFALTVGTPLVAIAYHRKTEDFVAQFGLDELCVRDTEMTPDQLIELFEKVQLRLDDLHVLCRVRAAELGARTRQAFADMLRRVM